MQTLSYMPPELGNGVSRGSTRPVSRANSLTWAIPQAHPGTEPAQIPTLDLPDDLLDADSVAIHFVAGEGLSFYPDYHLLEELFSDPALISRRRYRETLSGFLRDPDTSPEMLRRLAARDPAKASTDFARLLKRKRGFSWEADGEQLLRRSKPSYFDGTSLPHASGIMFMPWR